MPVKWDSEKDKFILNVLLTDPSVNIGAAAIENIIKSWPAEFGDPPSKKAVNEHFFKIRKTNKKFIEGNGTPGGTPGGTPAATPMKKARATPVKKNKNEPKTPTSKRKRKELGGLSDDDEEVDAVAVPKTELNGLDGANSDGGAARESPAKRARAAVKYEESAGEDADLSGSDFHIDEA